MNSLNLVMVSSLIFGSVFVQAFEALNEIIAGRQVSFIPIIIAALSLVILIISYKQAEKVKKQKE